MPDTPLTRGAAALQEAVRATRYPREGVYEQALADGNIPRRILDAVEESAVAPRKAKVRRLVATSTHLNLGGGGNCSSSSNNRSNTNTSSSNVHSNRRNIHSRNSTINPNDDEMNTPTHPRNNSSTSAVNGRGSGGGSGDENRKEDSPRFADNPTARRVKAQLEGFLPAGEFYCGRPGQMLGRGARSRRRTSGSSVAPKTRTRRVAATSTHANHGGDGSGRGSNTSNTTNDTFSTPAMGTGCSVITSSATSITTTNATNSVVDTSIRDRAAAMDTDSDSGDNEFATGSAAGGGLSIAVPSPSREHGGDHEGESSRPQGNPASPRAVAELKDFLPAGGFYVQRRRVVRSRSTSSSSAAESTADGDLGVAAPSPGREHRGDRARNSSRSSSNSAAPRAVAELKDFLPAGGFYVQRGRGTRSRSRHACTAGMDTGGRDKVGVSLRSSGRSSARRAVAQLKDFLPAGDFYVEQGGRGLRPRRRSDGSGVPAGVATAAASNVTTTTRARLVRSMSPVSGSCTAAGAASPRALQRSRSTSSRGTTQKARSSAAMKRKKPGGRGREQGGKIPFLCRICEIPRGSVYECDGPCKGCFHFNCVTNRDCALVAKYQRPKDPWYCGSCVSRRRRNLIDGLEPDYEFLRGVDKVKKKNHDNYIVGYTEVPYAPIPTELLTLGPKSSAVTSSKLTWFGGGGGGGGGGDPDCGGVDGGSHDGEGCNGGGTDSGGDGRRRRRSKLNRGIIIAPADTETPTQAERATLAALNAFVKDWAGGQGVENAVDGNETGLNTGSTGSQWDEHPLLEDMMASALGRLRNEALAQTLSITPEALITSADLPVLMPSTGLPDFYRGPWTYSRYSPSVPQVKTASTCTESPGFASVVGDGIGDGGVDPAPSPGCRNAEVVSGPKTAEVDGDAGGGGGLARESSSPDGGLDAVGGGLGGGGGGNEERNEMREMAVKT